MPRLNMLLTLMQREAMRLIKIPSALMLLGLMVTFSILLVLSRSEKKPPIGCWIVYPDAFDSFPQGEFKNDFLKALSQQAKQNRSIRMVPMGQVPKLREQRVYPPLTCAIELLDLPGASEGAKLSIAYRHPGTKSEVLEPFLRWFWPIAVDHFGQIAVQEKAPAISRPVSAATLVMEKLQSGSVGDLMNEDLAAAIQLLIIQFVACCQLMVSFTSQDRERGTLTALALSPITMTELMQAKLLFHLGLAGVGSACVVAVLKPVALANASLWVTLLLTGLGLCSVGLVIASLSKSQSSASLLALCYMLIGAVVFYLATRFSAFATLKSFSFEHYSFGMIYVSLQRSIPLASAVDLRPMLALVAVWLTAANILFRTRGWK